MIKVKLFGVIRLDTGIKELSVDVRQVKEIYPILIKEIKKNNPLSSITTNDLGECLVSINDIEVDKNAKLNDGDEVMLLSPAWRKI